MQQGHSDSIGTSSKTGVGSVSREEGMRKATAAAGTSSSNSSSPPNPSPQPTPVELLESKSFMGQLMADVRHASRHPSHRKSSSSFGDELSVVGRIPGGGSSQLSVASSASRHAPPPDVEEQTGGEVTTPRQKITETQTVGGNPDSSKESSPYHTPQRETTSELPFPREELSTPVATARSPATTRSPAEAEQPRWSRVEEQRDSRQGSLQTSPAALVQSATRESGASTPVGTTRSRRSGGSRREQDRGGRPSGDEIPLAWVAGVTRTRTGSGGGSSTTRPASYPSASVTEQRQQLLAQEMMSLGLYTSQQPAASLHSHRQTFSGMPEELERTPSYCDEVEETTYTGTSTSYATTPRYTPEQEERRSARGRHRGLRGSGEGESPQDVLRQSTKRRAEVQRVQHRSQHRHAHGGDEEEDAGSATPPQRVRGVGRDEDEDERASGRPSDREDWASPSEVQQMRQLWQSLSQHYQSHLVAARQEADRLQRERQLYVEEAQTVKGLRKLYEAALEKLPKEGAKGGDRGDVKQEDHELLALEWQKLAIENQRLRYLLERRERDKKTKDAAAAAAAVAVAMGESGGGRHERSPSRRLPPQQSTSRSPHHRSGDGRRDEFPQQERVMTFEKMQQFLQHQRRRHTTPPVATTTTSSSHYPSPLEKGERPTGPSHRYGPYSSGSSSSVLGAPAAQGPASGGPPFGGTPYAYQGGQLLGQQPHSGRQRSGGLPDTPSRAHSAANSPGPTNPYATQMPQGSQPLFASPSAHPHSARTGSAAQPPLYGGQPLMTRSTTTAWGGEGEGAGRSTTPSPQRMGSMPSTAVSPTTPQHQIVSAVASSPPMASQSITGLTEAGLRRFAQEHTLPLLPDTPLTQQAGGRAPPPSSVGAQETLHTASTHTRAGSLSSPPRLRDCATAPPDSLEEEGERQQQQQPPKKGLGPTSTLSTMSSPPATHTTLSGREDILGQSPAGPRGGHPRGGAYRPSSSSILLPSTAAELDAALEAEDRFDMAGMMRMMHGPSSRDTLTPLLTTGEELTGLDPTVVSSSTAGPLGTAGGGQRSTLLLSQGNTSDFNISGSLVEPDSIPAVGRSHPPAGFPSPPTTSSLHPNSSTVESSDRMTTDEAVPRQLGWTATPTTITMESLPASSVSPSSRARASEGPEERPHTAAQSTGATPVTTTLFSISPSFPASMRRSGAGSPFYPLGEPGGAGGGVPGVPGAGGFLNTSGCTTGTSSSDPTTATTTTSTSGGTNQTPSNPFRTVPTTVTPGGGGEEEDPPRGRSRVPFLYHLPSSPEEALKEEVALLRAVATLQKDNQRLQGTVEQLTLLSERQRVDFEQQQSVLRQQFQHLHARWQRSQLEQDRLQEIVFRQGVEIEEKTAACSTALEARSSREDDLRAALEAARVAETETTAALRRSYEAQHREHQQVWERALRDSDRLRAAVEEDRRALEEKLEAVRHAWDVERAELEAELALARRESRETREQLYEERRAAETLSTELEERATSAKAAAESAWSARGVSLNANESLMERLQLLEVEKRELWQATQRSEEQLQRATEEVAAARNEAAERSAVEVRCRGLEEQLEMQRQTAEHEVRVLQTALREEQHVCQMEIDALKKRNEVLYHQWQKARLQRDALKRGGWVLVEEEGAPDDLHVERLVEDPLKREKKKKQKPKPVEREEGGVGHVAAPLRGGPSAAAAAVKTVDALAMLRESARTLSSLSSSINRHTAPAQRC